MDAVAELEALFADGGRSILTEGGLGGSWAEALSHVPPELADIEGEQRGYRLLVRLREFWSDHHDLQPALAATRALLRWNAERHGGDHPDTLVELSTFGGLAMRAGRMAEGGQLAERAWTSSRERLRDDDLRLAVIAANAARHQVETGRLPEAAQTLEVAWRIRKRLAPDTTGVVAAQLAEVRVRLGDDAGARLLLIEAVAQYRAQFGAEHGATIARIRQLAGLHQRAGRFADAAPLWREAWAWLSSSGDTEGRAAVAFDLGIALERLEQRAEALRMLEESVRWTREAGDPHPALPGRLIVFANAEIRRGRVSVAEGLLRECVEAERRLSGDGSVPVAERYVTLGLFLAQTGRLDEALGWLDTAASLIRGQLGDQAAPTKAVVESLVALLLDRANIALAQRDREYASFALGRAAELAAPVLGHVHEKTRKVRDLRERNRL